MVTKVKLMSKTRGGFLDYYLPVSYVISAYSLQLAIAIFLIYGLYRVLSGKRIFVQKNFIYLLVAIFIGQTICVLLGYYKLELYIKSMVLIVEIALTIMMLSDALNIDVFIKVYKIVATLSVVVIIFQTFQIYILHELVKPIKILPFSSNDFAYWYSETNRPMAFFTEPQAASTYLLPLLVIMLRQEKTKWATVLSLGVLLTGSTQGIIMVAAIWVLKIVAIKGKLIRKVLLTIAILVAVFIIGNLWVFSDAMNKLSTAGTGLSDYLRLYKAFDTYKELPFREKIFGVGFNNMTDYISVTNYYFSWMSQVTNPERWSYISSAFGAFVEFGFLGAVFLYYHYYKLAKAGNIVVKLLTIVLIMQMFSQSLIFNAAFVFYVLIINNYLEKRKNYFNISLRR